jgi:hypothetical protein
MVSIFTGLAFMHGHIVDKELVLRLGAPETKTDGGKPVQKTAKGARQPVIQPVVQGVACAHGACC